jgi:hypothetical protein
VTDRPHVLGVREQHLGDIRRKDPCDRQRVTRRLEHHPVLRREAPREQLKLGRISPDLPRRPCATTIDDRDLTEIAMHIQPN